MAGTLKEIHTCILVGNERISVYRFQFHNKHIKQDLHQFGRSYYSITKARIITCAVNTKTDNWQVRNMRCT